ncbi:MAG: DUF5049 domain-containing protein [Candidatus Pelethousia sp.]|nr:DUF5049 domain-containing protein [Candidatus Pelethousia sp.]
MEQNRLISDKLVSQILAIRDSGKVNMFDVRGVQAEANQNEFYELVIFLEEHRKEYAEFILTGAR